MSVTKFSVVILGLNLIKKANWQSVILQVKIQDQTKQYR